MASKQSVAGLSVSGSQTPGDLRASGGEEKRTRFIRIWSVIFLSVFFVSVLEVRRGVGLLGRVGRVRRSEV